MALAISNSRFLGLDLHALAREFAAAWRQLQRLPALAWLTPAVPVRLLAADGSEASWQVEGARVTATHGKAQTPAFTAVELPEDFLLLRKLALPPLSSSDLDEAVALEVRGASPFAAGDVAWGYSSRQAAAGVFTIHVAIASRKQVMRYLQTLGARLPAAQAPEVWAVPDGHAPIVFNGFGEPLRLAHAGARRRVALGLLALALALATAVVVTPVAQARMRAVAAVQAYDALSRRVEPLVRQRGALAQATETNNALAQLLAQRSDPVYAMGLLAQALPDDAFLQNLQITGSKVGITGATGNAPALMQQLGVRPELRDVRAPTPATRFPGATRDNFNIEFTLAARAAPPPPVASPQALQAPAATGSASFGGATFGGGPTLPPVASPASPASPASSALPARKTP